MAMPEERGANITRTKHKLQDGMRATARVHHSRQATAGSVIRLLLRITSGYGIMRDFHFLVYVCIISIDVYDYVFYSVQVITLVIKTFERR